MNENRESGEQENDLVPAEKSLLDLDDMVLDIILKSLNIVDLTSVAETCTRLEALAQRNFSKGRTSVYWSRDGNIMPLNQSQRVFKQFGKHVKAITLILWTGDDFRTILRVIAPQCEKLIHLSLVLIRMDDTEELLLIPLIKVMFSKLELFRMGSCSWIGRCPLAVFFGDNSTLKDLSVANCCANNRIDYRLQMLGFRALKHLRLYRCQNVVNNEELVACFKNNNIQTLLIRNVVGVNLLAPNVIDCLTNTLHELSLGYFDGMLSDQLRRLRKLRVFRMYCSLYTNIDDLLSDLSLYNDIKQLILSGIRITKRTIEVFKNFTKLERLRLGYSLNLVGHRFFVALATDLPQLQEIVYAYGAIGNEDAISLVKSMPTLKRLSFFGCNTLAKETYVEMIRILSQDWHRPQLQFIPPLSDVKTLLEIKDPKKTIWVISNFTYQMGHRS